MTARPDGAGSLLVQDDVARRARSLVDRLPDSKRRKLNVGAVEKKADVALLPEDKALEVLRNHPIVQAFRLSAQDVHMATSKLLIPKDAPSRPTKKQHAPPMKHDVTEKCRHCKKGVLVKTTECVSCSACGLVDRGIIDYGNPYREFEDKPTRRHFEFSGEKDDGMHDIVEQVGGHMQLSRTTMFEASRLLRAHPHAAEGFVAATAALIVVTMTYESSTGTLHAPAPPPGFPCATCGLTMDSVKSARYHCRRGVSASQPQAVVGRASSSCLPRP